MKSVLIISPHFPPVNAPDMQRVRMSLPYFKEMGWEPVVICVDQKYVEGFFDEMLNKTIPSKLVQRLRATYTCPLLNAAAASILIFSNVRPWLL